MIIDLHTLPAWPQSQESLSQQITDLIMVANRLGLYDAADAVRQLIPELSKVKYGCHVDVEHGVEPDGCVIDSGDHVDCIYARPGMRKEQCKYWRVVAQSPTQTTLTTPAPKEATNG